MRVRERKRNRGNIIEKYIKIARREREEREKEKTDEYYRILRSNKGNRKNGQIARREIRKRKRKTK